MIADSLHNQALGKQGEALASDYLAAKGYTILQHNFRAGHQELDIIARKGDLLHFVEVKTRRTMHFGHGEDAMHNRKFTRLLQAIDAYLASFDVEPEWQLDLIVVDLRPKGRPNFIHYESVGPIDAR